MLIERIKISGFLLSVFGTSVFVSVLLVIVLFVYNHLTGFFALPGITGTYIILWSMLILNALVVGTPFYLLMVYLYGVNRFGSALIGILSVIPFWLLFDIFGGAGILLYGLIGTIYALITHRCYELYLSYF